MIKKVTIGIAALAVTSAFAWGPREQSALLGLGIGMIVGNQHSQPQYPQPQYQPPTVIYLPQQQICGYNVWCPTNQQLRCVDEATYDQFGRFISYQRVCRYN